MGGGQVADELVEFADRLGGQYALDPLGMLLRGQAPFGDGLAQDVGDPVAIGVGGTQLGGFAAVAALASGLF